MALFQEMTDLLRVHERMRAVAKVDDVVLLTTTKALNHGFDFLRDGLLGPIHHTWVQVTL